MSRGAVVSVATAGRGKPGSVALDNGVLRLVCAPEFGARVVSLVDLRTGREWLTRGRPPAGSDAADAVFGGEAAYGWDECLPSVAPADDPVVRGGQLRDHGDAWGRPADLRLLDAAFETTSAGLDWPFAFCRRLGLDGQAVVAEYSLESTAGEGGPALPFLWSMHPLFALEPGARLELSDAIDEVLLTHGAGTGLEAGGRVGWPVARRRHGEPLALDEIRSIDAGQALKLYAGPLSDGRARAVAPDGASIALTWDARVAPFVGLWLDYGGWPSAEPAERLHQVALEPTTAPADDLAGALAVDRALLVRPGERVAWWVRIEVAAPPR